MNRLIKKYKNRRLYDTEISQYVTLEQLQRYVVDGVLFQVQDSETGKDLTNSILLQIMVEMETSTTQFLSTEMLRQLILFASHPMHASLKNTMEQWLHSLNSPYQQTTKAWDLQGQEILEEWKKIFKISS